MWKIVFRYFSDLCIRYMIIGGGGGLFIYSCSARRISFEFELISKEIRRA